MVQLWNGNWINRSHVAVVAILDESDGYRVVVRMSNGDIVGSKLFTRDRNFHEEAKPKAELFRDEWADEFNKE